MSRIFYCIVGVWPLLSNLPVAALPSIDLIDLGGRVQPSSVVPAVFGGSEQRLDLTVQGITPQADTSLRADLFQLAGSLAMPIARNIRLEESIALSQASPSAEQVTLKFPEVKQRAEILVRLSLFENTSQNTPTQLGDLHFEVFPASVTRELVELLQPKSEGTPQAVVFGPGHKLRHFLAALHVPIEDAGTGTPDRFDPARLYFGELATDQQFQEARDRGAGARMALFFLDDTLPAGVYADRSHSGVLVQVTLPLLDNLADDPRSQLGLTKIIHLLSAPPPSAN